MNILELTQQAGITVKRMAGTNGGEYAGPCPACGGQDRFRVWPEQGENGTWWCRQCDRSGDDIQFCREFLGMSFQDACLHVGRVPRRPGTYRHGLGEINPKGEKSRAEMQSAPLLLGEKHRQKTLATGKGPSMGKEESLVRPKGSTVEEKPKSAAAPENEPAPAVPGMVKCGECAHFHQGSELGGCLNEKTHDGSIQQDPEAAHPCQYFASGTA